MSWPRDDNVERSPIIEPIHHQVAASPFPSLHRLYSPSYRTSIHHRRYMSALVPRYLSYLVFYRRGPYPIVVVGRIESYIPLLVLMEPESVAL